MPLPTPSHLTPRRIPRQARAAVTLTAIFDATIQLLIADGPQRLTTTKVALRAGVSVGTLYQYFPHKQALFYALNQHYLEKLAHRVEVACRDHHGMPISRMVAMLVTTYWEAKTERSDVTRALYKSAVELDNEALVEAFARRVDVATRSMLGSASDASFKELPIVTLTLLTTIFGAVRNAFERNLEPEETGSLRQELIRMCSAYLDTARAPGRLASSQTKAHGQNRKIRPWRLRT